MAKNSDMLADMLFGDLLTTPGYDVDFAVGTTYSLDLKALLVIPYSLGMFGDLDSSAQASPLFLLEAIRRSADRFALFCNRGNIHVPKELADCYPLLEGSIFEVWDRQKPEANFHPKVWVIKEHSRERQDDRQLKVVVMSKNLSLSNDIEMVVAMTGKIGAKKSRNSECHRPLADFLRKLAGFADNTKQQKKRDKITELAENVLRVEAFEVDESRFEPEGYEFIPYWMGKCLNDRAKSQEFYQGRSMIIVSPFIDDKTLDGMTRRVAKERKKTLVTRREYVTRRMLENFDDVYAVNEFVAGDENHPTELHAKTFFISNSRYDNRLILGSANATQAAFNRNTEFLVSLRLKAGNYLLEKFRKEFLQQDDEGNSELYERIESAPETAQAAGRSEFDRQMCRLLSQKMKAQVVESGNGCYTVEIRKVAGKLPDFEISISLMTMPERRQKLARGAAFENVPLARLTELYIIRARAGEENFERVVKIPTADIPTGRNDEIFRSIVNTKEKFYNYISFMLCDDPESFVFEMNQMERIFGAANADTADAPMRIYEQMLKTAARNPSELERLEDVARIVKEKGYAADFMKLYETFKPLIPKLKQLL